MPQESFWQKSHFRMRIDHTFVDDSLRGQGVAGELVRRTVALLTEQGKQVTATCSYAAHWLEKHQK